MPSLLRPARAAVLPVAHNLKEDLAAALDRRQPLVVMVSLEGCPFCKVARDHYLAPLHAHDGVPVAQVDMRTRTRVYDFQGRPVTHDDLARTWKIRIAPTVLFFGRGGAEVAERLVGGYIPDFYGAYLDQRLAQARASLR
jgi:thioredoxin-related protein